MVKRKRYPVKDYNPCSNMQHPLPRKNKLLMELRKQKLSGTLCDVVFVYENFELYSHACVLASFSPYMMKLLLLDYHNNVIPQLDSRCFKVPLKINLSDIFHKSSCICCKCFSNIIDFMYTSKIYMYNCHLNHIEYAATMLQINELITVCTKYKESKNKKCKFNTIVEVDDHVTDANHGDVATRINIEQKLCQSKLNRNETRATENVRNPESHKNTVYEYIRMPKSVSNTEYYSCKKLKLSALMSAQNSNKELHKAETKTCHPDNSESIASILPKNLSMFCNIINKQGVHNPLIEDYDSQSLTDKARLKESVSAEQNNFKRGPNDVHNIIKEQKIFSSNVSENKNSIKYGVSKNEDVSLVLYKNKSKMIFGKNICTAGANQLYFKSIQQANHITQEKTEISYSPNHVAEEKINVTTRCIAEFEETKGSLQSDHDSTSRNKKEAQIHIPLAFDKENQSSCEEKANSVDTEDKDNTDGNSKLKAETVCRNQLTDLNINKLNTKPVISKEQKGMLTNNQGMENGKNVLLSNVTDLASVHLVECAFKSNCNATSNNFVADKRDNHDSELSICKAEVEKKVNIQIEKNSKETKTKNKFCCEVCQYKTLRLSKIVEHLEANDHGQTSCSICKYTFNDNKEFRNHLKLHTENIPFECLTCSKKFKSITYFKNHLQSHSNDKLFVCPICKASFKYSYKLSRHKVKKHSEPLENKFICEHCKYTTYEKDKLILHLQDHGFTVPVFTCTTKNCRFQTTREISLIAHEKTHLKTDSFFCQICGSKFSHEKNLKRHIHEKHNPGSLKLECSKCNFQTNRKYSLKIHVAQHCKEGVKPKPKMKTEHSDRKRICSNNKPADGKIKPYECEICHIQFINRGNIRRHKIALHNMGVLKMKCEKCSYSTTRDDLYRKHLMKHDSTQAKMNCKQRTLACKADDCTEHLVKTLHSNEILSCQATVNCPEMPKYHSQKLSVSENRFLTNKSDKNMVENNYEESSHINSCEVTAYCHNRENSITDVINDYSKIFMCEKCGEMIDSEENLQIHSSEIHIVEHAIGSQIVGDLYIQNEVPLQAKKLDRSRETGSYIGILKPVNKGEVGIEKNNLSSNSKNKKDIVLPHSDKHNTSHQQKSNKSMNCSLPLSVSGHDYEDMLLLGKDNLNFRGNESRCCDVKSTEEENKLTSVNKARTLVLNEETGELRIVEVSGAVGQSNQNYSDKNVCYDMSSSSIQKSMSNLYNPLNRESCNIVRTCSSSRRSNLENTKPCAKSDSSDVFLLHNVANLNKTIILNETTGNINIIFDNTCKIINDSESNTLWQNADSASWILDESTGTLTNAGICNDTNESLALNKQREVISFSNQNTHVILNEGTGELTFINLNSDTLEENENNDMLGNSLYFDDDTQSNFSVDSLEEFSVDNISLPSPGTSNERNSVTEFLNELTGEINSCNFSSDSNSGQNMVNHSNCVQYNFKGKNNSEMTWNPSSEEDEDLTFLNELTGELLQSTSKLESSSNMLSNSVNVENNPVPTLDTRNALIVKNEILNEITGELSVHLDDELTKESADSIYLNEETGLISLNALNQVTSESNILDKNADWFFENLQNDSLDSFTADDDNFSKQFQYNIFLNSPSDDLTLHPDSNDMLLNESTGELISTVCDKSQQ